MLSRLLSPTGILALLLVFYKPLWWGLSAAGNVTVVVDNAERLGNVLASSWGWVVMMLLGFFLLYRALRTTPAPDAQPELEAEASRVKATEAEQELQSTNEQLKQQNEELTQRLDERKRKRVDGWREFFNNFDYVNENVWNCPASVDTFRSRGILFSQFNLLELRRAQMS